MNKSVYECIEKCKVSNQFGDDINIELGTKWQLVKNEQSVRYETHKMTETSVDYSYLTDESERIIKVTNDELRKYFKEVEQNVV